MLLNSPDVADRVACVGDLLLYGTLLPARVKTLTGLIAAREYDCDYEWAGAVGLARKAGIEDTLINAIRDGEALTGLSKEQQDLVDFCHQLLRGNHHVSDTTYGAVVGHFGVAATVQIAATIGYFVMQAVLLNAFEVAPKTEESEFSL